jgi:hypothetical protein
MAIIEASIDDGRSATRSSVLRVNWATTTLTCAVLNYPNSCQNGAMRLTHLLVAIASLATVYAVVASSGNACAVAWAPAELMQWHSGLTVASGSCVKPEWKTTLTAIAPEDSTASRVMHGAVGLCYVAADQSDYSLDFFAAPKGARKPARDPGGTRGGSPGMAR